MLCCPDLQAAEPHAVHRLPLPPADAAARRQQELRPVHDVLEGVPTQVSMLTATPPHTERETTCTIYNQRPWTALFSSCSLPQQQESAQHLQPTYRFCIHGPAVLLCHQETGRWWLARPRHACTAPLLPPFQSCIVFVRHKSTA